MAQRGNDAHGGRVGLRVQRTGEAVKGVAANAATRFGVLLIEQNADRQMERLNALSPQAVVHLLHPRFVAHCWPWERVIAGWLGGIFAACAVNGVELFRPGVVARQVFIADRPRGRYTVVVLDLGKITLAEAEQD